MLFLSPFVHHHIDGNVQGAIWDTLAVNLYRMGPSFINSPYLGEIRSLYRDGFAGILYRGEVAQQGQEVEHVKEIEHVTNVDKVGTVSKVDELGFGKVVTIDPSNGAAGVKCGFVKFLV